MLSLTPHPVCMYCGSYVCMYIPIQRQPAFPPPAAGAPAGEAIGRRHFRPMHRWTHAASWAGEEKKKLEQSQRPGGLGFTGGIAMPYGRWGRGVLLGY
jgi:hypothetical protein